MELGILQRSRNLSRKISETRRELKVFGDGICRMVTLREAMVQPNQWWAKRRRLDSLSRWIGHGPKREIFE